MGLSFDEEDSFKEVVGSLRFDNPASDPNSVAQELQEVGSSGMPQERNEDNYFNNSSSDPNALPQESRGDIEIIPA